MAPSAPEVGVERPRRIAARSPRLTGARRPGCAAQDAAPTLSPMEKVDRLERLTDLVLVLLRDGPARSLRQIAEEVPGYPEGAEARRQAFERDKRTLRDEGVEITTERIDGPEQTGTGSGPRTSTFPTSTSAPEEQAALNLAVAGVHLGDPSGRDALWRLGLPAASATRPIADVPALPALPVLYEALRRHATVHLRYRGEERHVDPARLLFRNGRWYLVGPRPRPRRAAGVPGRPHRRRARRRAPQGSAELPDGFDAEGALPDDPWRIGEGEPVAVDVLVDAPMARLVVGRDVDESAVAERRPDGVGGAPPRGDQPAARCARGCSGSASTPRCSRPPEVRAEMVAWLEGHRPGRRAPAGGGAVTAVNLGAGQRLRRLLAVLGWLARRGGPRSPSWRRASGSRPTS